MADIVLRVTPDVLRQKSGEFTDIIKQIKAHFDRVESISAKTKGYWQGDAGTRDRESYASYKSDIQYIVRRLEEHPTDLLTMAGIYSEAEKTVVATNAQLKTNEIV